MAELNEIVNLPSIAGLFARATEIHFVKGQLIIHPDDSVRDVYLIQSGMVKIYSLNNQGEEYIHIFYGKGEIFPLLWLLGGTAARRNVFVTAASAVNLLRVPIKTVQETLRQRPEISYALLHQVTKQFNIYADRLDNLEYKYASERLAYRLLFLASRFGEQRGGTILLPSLTQQDIAATINVSRESANRELERLERKGLIARQGRRIVLCDVTGLSKELHADIDPLAWQNHV